VPGGGTAQAFQGSVNYPGNHTLDDLGNAGTVLSTLTFASDHLPVVADYSLGGGLAGSRAERAGAVVCVVTLVRRARRHIVTGLPAHGRCTHRLEPKAQKTIALATTSRRKFR